MVEKDESIAHVVPARRVWRLLFLHPVRLIGALIAEHARPGRLGAAGAFGALIGTLPLIGLHTVLVYLGARRFMLNRVVALGANQLGIPPLVPGVCIEVGYYLRHGSWLTEVSLRTIGSEAPQRLLEWMLGSLVVGPILAGAVGGAIWLLAMLLQRRQPAADDVGCHRKRGEAAPAGQP